MVSSAPRGRQQSARGRSMGQPRGGDNLTRFGQYAGDGGIRGGRYFALCQGPTAPRSIGARACSTIAHIDRFYWKVRLRASWAPAESGSMSVNCRPRHAGRRHPPPDRPLPPGFSELGGAGDLDRFLPESDFVVICCQWTPETTRLFDKDRFAAMKAGGVLINVARGEIVDEEALADALQRDHLRGAALDVYVGEFEHTPMSRLWSDPRVLITPHISSASDQDRHGAINLFCDNLRAYLEGGPLRNVIDWERGY